MVDRRDLGSWLEGPPVQPGQWPGRRLGLPQGGSGSIARPGRRVAALCIDWGMSYLIALLLAGGNQGNEFLILAVFAAEQIMLVGTLGYSFGHRLLGIHVRKLDGGAPGPLAAIVRTLLLCLVVPALVFDPDQRGLHDRAMGTVLVRN
ncbi:RDD family protein [Arthrobacter sp. I2-34]|uniref:RDD family protein n=1 Tax=Arthrobacter hankyongi TaxID=2904801 RepID=A0ABS9LBN1_9MICC|nr:RDD family protein [Arthrobacter hankyongi]MCG2623879.1 RDD family protein [Arthrobacter hankyongi]